MILRKFLFILTMIISTCLFCAGVMGIHYMNRTDTKKNNETNSSKNDINSILKPYAINNNPFNMLVLVGDKSNANTDTIMVINYNPATNSLNVLSIPRDTRVDVQGIGFPKINSFYSRKNGLHLLVQSLNEAMGIRLNYYMYVNISTFKEIVDLLGGVDYYVPADMYYRDPSQDLLIDLKKGFQHLDGDKAEQLLRFRHPSPNHYNSDLKKIYDGSDLDRINVQQNFIRELIKQKATIYNLSKIDDIVDIVYRNLETNITQNTVIELVKNIPSFNLNNVQMFMVPGGSATINGVSYYVFDKDKLSEIISSNFQTTGDILSFPDVQINMTKSNKKDYTKNNPSNSESSLKKVQTPEP